MSNKWNVFGGFLAGAAMGALAGILFAPDSGAKTRKKIAKNVGDWEDEFEKIAKKEIESARVKLKDKIDEYSEMGKKVLANAKEKEKK